MALDSRHLSVVIDRPVDEVYAYVAEPANLPTWAAGLGGGVAEVDGRWFVETPGGRIEVRFAPPNEFGVLDHWVTLPTGDVAYNPLRVFPNEDSCEVVFTVRRPSGMAEDAFERDCGAVQADLGTLKQLLETVE